MARERFFRSRLTNRQEQAENRSREREEKEKRHVSSAGQVQPLLLPPQPPQQQEQRHQRQHEKQRAAPVVNGAVDHVRADMYAEQSDDQDPKPVPHDPERNHEGHQHDPSPRVFRKRWDASRLVMNSTQLERIPLHSCATLSTIPGSSKTVPSRSSGVPVTLKNRAAASADASMEAFSSQSTAASGSGTMKIRNATGKAACGHPFRAEEQKPTGRDETHKSERHQGESIVDAQAPTPRDSCSQRRDTDCADDYGPGSRSMVGDRASPLGDVKQVARDKRYYKNVRIEVALGRVLHKPGQGLNKQEQKEDEVTGKSSDPRLLLA